LQESELSLYPLSCPGHCAPRDMLPYRTWACGCLLPVAPQDGRGSAHYVPFRISIWFLAMGGDQGCPCPAGLGLRQAGRGPGRGSSFCPGHSDTEPRGRSWGPTGVAGTRTGLSATVLTRGRASPGSARTGLCVSACACVSMHLWPHSHAVQAPWPLLPSSRYHA
jgi:hypothetical protein